MVDIADHADPRLTSYMENPCICGEWPLSALLHRLRKGHWPKWAARVNAEGRLVAHDGEVGAEAP